MSNEGPVDKLRMLIEEAVARGEAKGTNTYVGGDWWQVSAAESEVFGLEAADMPRLSTVYDAYEQVLDLGSCALPVDDTDCEAIRKAMPWLRVGTIDDGDFGRFAQAFDVLPKKAHGMFWKMMFWQVRQGYIDILPYPAEQNS